MGLAEQFQEIVDALPDDWTDLTLDLRLPSEERYIDAAVILTQINAQPYSLDLRLPSEERYIDAAVILTQINAQPYSRADWHWRINVANKFGKAAAASAVKGTLALLDQEGIEGELVLRDFREGRAEIRQLWGRPESVRREFRRSRSL